MSILEIVGVVALYIVASIAIIYLTGAVLAYALRNIDGLAAVVIMLRIVQIEIVVFIVAGLIGLGWLIAR